MDIKMRFFLILIFAFSIFAKDFNISNLYFNETKAKYIVSIKDNREKVSFNLIIPSDVFSYKITNAKSESTIKYAGIVRNYHICNLLLSPIESNKNIEIELSFEKRTNIANP